nr:MAG TPA: hypothetical protein [Caudoviricetes sp.]
MADNGRVISRPEVPRHSYPSYDHLTFPRSIDKSYKYSSTNPSK